MTSHVATSNTVTVEIGQYVPLPGTNDLVLGGPGKLQVNRHTDGRLSHTILEGGSVPTTVAVHKKWARLTWGV